MKPLALFDMDGTLADFDGMMRIDLRKIASPGDRSYLESQPDESNDPDWLVARKSMIKRQPNWWLKLPKYQPGFDILYMAETIGYNIEILTKGPKSNYDAWAQKLEWCRTWITGDYPVTITEDKSTKYGRVLVDDWPPYVLGWLKHRPRGTVIMPLQRWNIEFKHPQVVTYNGGNSDEVREALQRQFDRK